ISKFIESVKNTNQLQFQEFQEKVKKIEDLKQDNQRLMVELKDPNTTPERKAQIQEILKKNTQQIKNLINELKTHPARGFFDQEAISLINNAKQWLVTGNYPGAGSGLGGSKGRGKTGGGKAERENRQSELEKKQIEQIERQLAGFQPKPKDTEPLSWCKDGYLGIKDIDEAKNTIEEGEEAVLIYTEEQKKHFIRILEDIDDFLNNEGKLNLNAE
ncbi:28462_t:CDS:2, partial [Racocetra persica]